MKNKSILILIFAALLMQYCSGNQPAVLQFSGDGKYDGLENNSNASGEFEKLWSSVKLINSIAYYNSYSIPFKTNLTTEEIIKGNVNLNSFPKTFFTDNASGTAAILSNNNGNILFLTCAHILDFPDTIFSYYTDTEGRPLEIVESISIKIDQNNYVSDMPNDGHVEIVAVDKRLDAVLAGGKYAGEKLLKQSVFPFKIGNADELSWANYVYIFGYPLNRKMVTKGLVSLYESNPEDYFLIDAVFNRGISGGVVLAVRDGAPNYEFVGMVKSSPASSKIVLKPYDYDESFLIIPKGPFEGLIKIEREMEMKYGISKVVTINAIIDFTLRNKKIIIDKGFEVPEKFLNN